jgi:type III secretion protein Q
VLKWSQAGERDDGLPAASLLGQAPALAALASAQLRALNAFYRRRDAFDLELAGRSATIAAAWPPPSEALSPGYRLDFTIDGVTATASVSASLVEAVASGVDPNLSLAGLAPEHAGILVEFALSDQLAALEQRADCRFAITAVHRQAHALERDDTSLLSCSIKADGLGGTWAGLRLAPGHIERLAQLLDCRAASVDPTDKLAITVSARVAAATLSVGEVAGLSPGDVVLVDEHCRQPLTAIAVIGEHLVACLELTAAGGRIVTGPVRGRGSAWEWSMEKVPDAAQGDVAEGNLDDLPVKLVFELGRLDLSLGEVRKLAPGAVVPLVRPVEESLVIIANGRRIGRGMLVQIGDSLGVRLTRLFENV